MSMYGPRVRAKQVKAGVAQLLDYFKDFSEIIRLTDRQKAEIVAHKRDEKTGAIVWPSLKTQRSNVVQSTDGVTSVIDTDDPTTIEDHMAAADLVAAICAAASPAGDKDKLRDKIAAEMKARIKEKYGNRESTE